MKAFRSGLLWPLFSVLLLGCGGESPVSPPDPRALVDTLLRPPHDDEVATVAAEFDDRPYTDSPGGLEVLETRPGTYADLSLVSYRCDGLRIYGVISRPKAPGTYPLVLYNHGGDRGMGPSDLDHPLAAGFVQAASSFRSEAVRWFGVEYRSDGSPSPWDRDVDDALALLECAGDLPGVDATRALTLGGSRGGGVSLLAAARRPDRFRCVVDVFGPTDFFDPFFRAIADSLAAGGNDSRPGMAFLKEALILPYLSGSLSLPAARSELIRRSALYFADRLPPTQIHHGADDEVVPISQSDRLADRLSRLGRPFEYFQYPGAGHDGILAPEMIPRVLTFIQKYL